MQTTIQFNKSINDVNWLALFHETLRTHLKPEQIELWKAISERIGKSLTVKNEIFAQERQPK